jgi:hypothetical protein
MQDMAKLPAHWRAADPEERSTPAVSLVFELLVPRLGYKDRSIINDGQWGVARKPGDE